MVRLDLYWLSVSRRAKMCTCPTLKAVRQVVDRVCPCIDRPYTGRAISFERASRHGRVSRSSTLANEVYMFEGEITLPLLGGHLRPARQLILNVPDKPRDWYRIARRIQCRSWHRSVAFHKYLLQNCRKKRQIVFNYFPRFSRVHSERCISI